MDKETHSAEQIIRKLREAEVLLGKGMPTKQVARKLGVCEETSSETPAKGEPSTESSSEEVPANEHPAGEHPKK